MLSADETSRILVSLIGICGLYCVAVVSDDKSFLSSLVVVLPYNTLKEESIIRKLCNLHPIGGLCFAVKQRETTQNSDNRKQNETACTYIFSSSKIE